MHKLVQFRSELEPVDAKQIQCVHASTLELHLLLRNIPQDLQHCLAIGGWDGIPHLPHRIGRVRATVLLKLA